MESGGSPTWSTQPGCVGAEHDLAPGAPQRLTPLMARLEVGIARLHTIRSVTASRGGPAELPPTVTPGRFVSRSNAARHMIALAT